MPEAAPRPASHASFQLNDITICEYAKIKTAIASKWETPRENHDNGRLTAGPRSGICSEMHQRRTSLYLRRFQ